jgi:hypothetical protein
MTPNPQTEDELGIAPDPYAHHDQTDCVPAFDEPRPTRKQLNYLRILAQRTGQTFAYPRTAAQASREIRRLKSTPASSCTEVRIERKQIADAIAAGPADSTAVRVDEITGHGSTATWAHNRDREPAVAPDPEQAQDPRGWPADRAGALHDRRPGESPIWSAGGWGVTFSAGPTCRSRRSISWQRGLQL